MIDWSPTEKANVQLTYEHYSDRYQKSTYGLESGKGQIASIDGSYAINDMWKLNGWYSVQTGDSKQYMLGGACSTGNNNTCTLNTYTKRTAPVDFTQWFPWNATLSQTSTQFGLGLTGKKSLFEFGGQYVYSRDINRQTAHDLPATTATARVGAAPPYTYTQTAVDPGMGIIPDTKYVQNTLKLNSTYAYSKATKFRVDYVYDQRKMDDYTWQNWIYADGTRVFVNPKQTTQILAFSIIQAF